MTENEGTGPGRLAIGELARLAGVTPRAIRHYHSAGLLPEPDRDRSGYRRYGVVDLVAVVRIVRLRALGMSIPQIAAQLAVPAVPWPAALRALAQELDHEIEHLTATRDRVLQLADSADFDDPARVLAAALGPPDPAADEEVRARERAAASLLDALHPDGVRGALRQAEGALLDPVTRGAVATIVRQVQGLEATTSDDEITALAQAAAAVLPRPDQAATPIDLDLMDKLIGHGLNDGQRRFMRELRRAWGVA